MRKKKQEKKEQSSEFDCARFEQEAIAGLQSGSGLVGTEGVLTSLIQRLRKLPRNGAACMKKSSGYVIAR